MTLFKAEDGRMAHNCGSNYDKVPERKRWENRLAIAANYVVKCVGAAVFAFLLWYALRYTCFVMPGGREIPVEMHDSWWKNFFGVLPVLGVMTGLLFAEKKLSANIQQIVSGVSVMLAMLWVGGMGLWWVNSAVRIPNGDCAFVYGAASYFQEGRFLFLETPGNYCSMYPHQLGLIALTEVLFLFAGTYNFFAFQRLCVIFAIGIVFTGYLILREITTDVAGAVLYCITVSCCFPLIFYTSWVYGDLPGTFFALMAVWMLLRYSRSRKGGWLAGMVSMVTMAMLNRKNSMILIVALCLTVSVSMLKKRDWKLLLAAVLCIVVPWLSYVGIYKMYEVRSGYEHYPGIPVITWIDMGLHDVEGVCGWYDDSAKQLYYSADNDAEQTAMLSALRIRERLKELWENPSYALAFFKKKILSQWNAPLYQSVYFNTMYQPEDMPHEDSLAARIGREYFSAVLSFCDRLQFIVYLGLFAYFIWGIRRDSDILQQVTVVTVIGGFLFSILWEAKARYIFPYYVMMFPFAAVGYQCAGQAVIALMRKRRKAGEEVNIIEFKKSA